MDSNSPDDDHWWYRIAEGSDPKIIEMMAKTEATLLKMDYLKPGQKLYEFFAQPGESPRQRTAEDFRALQRNISFEGQTLSSLAGAMQRDMSFPHWGINE